MTTPRPSSHPSLPGAFLLGALAAVASAFAGCQPGALPCDSDEWRDVCQGAASGGGSGSGSGGMTGGSGGMAAGGSGGMAGGMGGMAGGMGGMTAGTAVTAASAVANCAAYPTAGDMDNFFSMRCGGGSTDACHGALYKPAWNDLKSVEVWKRLPDLKSIPGCPNAPLIDKADHTKGVLWQKTLAGGKCPNGSTITGMRMPQMLPGMPLMLLTPAETTCLENYLKLFK